MILYGARKSMVKRGKLIIGNWKLNGSKRLIRELLDELERDLKQGVPDGLRLAVCPPSIYVSDLVSMAEAKGAQLIVGCQNISSYSQGSFTGELSAKMIKDAGCQICLVGHSERRTLFLEDDLNCRDKMGLLLDEGIIPVLCIGETLAQKQAGETNQVLREQLRGALSGLGLTQKRIIHIAYEPVYAIGTGHAVTPDQAQAIHQAIRQMLNEIVGDELAKQISILYGGSVTRDNALSLVACADVDGLLIGGASLSPEHFRTICKKIFALAKVFNYPGQLVGYENYLDAV
jgi:triosephosphate isomerase (TIM)